MGLPLPPRRSTTSRCSVLRCAVRPEGRLAASHRVGVHPGIRARPVVDPRSGPKAMAPLFRLPLLGFSAPSATWILWVRFTRVCLTRHVPSLRFLTSSTALLPSTPCDSQGATATHGVQILDPSGSLSRTACDRSAPRRDCSLRRLPGRGNSDALNGTWCYPSPNSEE
jgi:hypothetical protein